ncbi:MAG TPA: lysozyme inhibitor LprI family protein [Thermoanaerobaculia bacterium]|jgi:uncharacterized protein YecT (DUF1311 family)
MHALILAAAILTHRNTACGYRLDAPRLRVVEQDHCAATIGTTRLSFPAAEPPMPEDAEPIRHGRWGGWSSPTRTLLRGAAGRLVLLEGSDADAVMRALVLTDPDSAKAALAEHGPCESAANTIELNECAFERWVLADEALNAAWQRVTAKLEPEAKAKLVAAQKQWLAFRDSACAAEAFAEGGGGTIETMLNLDCRARLTRERTAHLEVIDEWRE